MSRKKDFDLKLKYEGVRILDHKFNNFEDLEETMKEMKLKFRGRK